LRSLLFQISSKRALVFGDDLVDEARSQGGLLADGLAGQHHLRRLLQAHQPRQALRPAEARDDAQLRGGGSPIRGVLHVQIFPDPPRDKAPSSPYTRIDDWLLATIQTAVCIAVMMLCYVAR